jgi:putative phosphoesterase
MPPAHSSPTSSAAPASSPPPASPPWRIAVFGDTHDRFPADLPARLAVADELWHLGDVCDPATLVEFELTRRPLTVVRGNNDWLEAWPLTQRLERRGRVFHLEHIAPRGAPAGVDCVLSGHTHVPADQRDAAGVRWLNPGCITRPRAQVRSFAWLTLDAHGAFTWETVAL